jgi:adenosine deaminase
VIPARTPASESTARELDALLAHRDEIAGLDLAADEAGFPVDTFADQLLAGRAAGWRLRAAENDTSA